MLLTTMAATPSSITDAYQWCAYCFVRLDPEDHQVERRAFVQCTHCQSHYHASCWQQSVQCVKCGEDAVMPCNNLALLPTPRAMQPVQAVTVKPSAIFYYLGGSAYAVPPFVLEQLVPAYEYWQPRLQTKLTTWHGQAQAISQNALLAFAQQWLAHERFASMVQFIHAHLAVLTQLLVYLFYAGAFWVIRLLLRLIF